MSYHKHESEIELDDLFSGRIKKSPHPKMQKQVHKSETWRRDSNVERIRASEGKVYISE